MRRAQLCMSPGHQITVSLLSAPHHATTRPDNHPRQLHKQESQMRKCVTTGRRSKRGRLHQGGEDRLRGKIIKDLFWFIITWVWGGVRNEGSEDREW